MNDVLADYLEIWGSQQDVIIFSDGSLGIGLALEPVDISCWANTQVNDFSARIASFLNSLPHHLDLQFVQDICPGNATKIEGHAKLVEQSAHKIVERVTSERVRRLKRLDEEGQIPHHGLKLFIRKPLSSSLLGRPKLFAKQAKFEAIANERLEQELASLERIKQDILSSLRSLGVTATQLTIDEIHDLIYLQWNPSRPVERSGYDPDNLRSSLLFTDVAIYDRGFSMGDIHHRIISLKILPDRTFAGMAAQLRNLPFGSRLFLSIHLPDQQKELESLQTQRRVAFSMVSGKRGGMADIESEAKLADLEGLLEEMVSQGEKVFHVSLNVLLRSEIDADLEEQVSQTLMCLRELSGAEGMEESLAAFDVFSQCGIPNARAKERSKRLKTSNLADFLPLFGPWVGHSTPRILLRSRLGSLVAFDPFSAELTNSNQLVSGGSGSGKSFLTNILLMQMLKENPKIFIVDIGGSYRKLTDNLSGQYIPLGVDSALSLNPFDLAIGETEPNSQKLKFILSLVEVMTKEDSEPRLGKLERAEIENAIQRVYQKCKQPTMSDLREILLEHPDPQINRYGKILGTWCGDTPYGQFIDRPTTIQLNRSIVCFDLKGMEAYPDLQAVFLFIITDFVWREVQGDRSTMKFLVFDECWKLLESESGASFIGEVFRTFRKYRASAVAISQNVDDFARSKIATALLSNSSIKWILRQKGADQDRLREVLALNDNELSQVGSLHQERGVFSEAFLMAEDRRCVVAIESTPLEYWLATTDPRDLAIIDERLKEAPDKAHLEILTELARQFPRGMAVAG